MPVLEDTVDFKVATLNDLLDADVRTGVPVAADEKYKRWAFLSTGLAGMLLVALIVALATGGGGDDAGKTKASEEIPLPPNTRPVNINAGTNLDDAIVPGTTVSLYNEGKVVAASGTVLKVTSTEVKVPAGAVRKTVRVAVAPEEADAVNAAMSSGSSIRIVEGAAATTTTTAPPSTTPTPIEPAPAPAPAPS